MIAFKDRSMLKQYIPNKDIKVWCLVDSTTGFIIAIIVVYTGKENIIRNSTLGERVVLNFADKIRPDGSILVLDNFSPAFLLRKIY